MTIEKDHYSLETQEWLEALESVLEKEGVDRAHYILTACRQGQKIRCVPTLFGDHRVSEYHPCQ